MQILVKFVTCVNYKNNLCFYLCKNFQEKICNLNASRENVSDIHDFQLLIVFDKLITDNITWIDDALRKIRVLVINK